MTLSWQRYNRSAKYDPISFACSDSNYLPTPGGIPVNKRLRWRKGRGQGVEREEENRLKPIIPADSRGGKRLEGGADTMGFRANFTSLKIYRQDVKALIKAGLEQPLRFRNFPLRSFAVIASGLEDHCRKLTLSSIFSFPSFFPPHSRSSSDRASSSNEAQLFDHLLGDQLPFLTLFQFSFFLFFSRSIDIERVETRGLRLSRGI